jgi:VIT1/CCC1 family predicted Fe2+/Mn2+ transporter
MFGKNPLKKTTVEALEKRIDSAVKKTLTDILGNIEDTDTFSKKIKSLKEEIEQLKSTKKIEEAEIKHLVRMKGEKLELEHQKKEVELQEEFAKKQMQLQQDYHDKVLAQIELARKEQKETYTEIMKRLPNVNMEIKQTKRR